MVHALDEVGRFSDVELVRQLERLVKADRELSAKLLVHLGEVDARGLAYGARSEHKLQRANLGVFAGFVCADSFGFGA